MTRAKSLGTDYKDYCLTRFRTQDKTRKSKSL